MYPELFDIGPVTVHSFGVMMALAFITAGLVTGWQLSKRGISTDLTYTLLIAAIVGGVVGAKIHYLIIHPDRFEVAAFSGTGLVWYGGLFGGIAAVALVAYLSAHPTALIADAVAPGLAVGYAVGRIGCFLNGDDYGVPTDLPWGMAFPDGSPPTTETVHPTQLYETFGSLFILALLLWVLAPRLARTGSLFWSYLGLAGVERFLVEFVRTNPEAALGLTQQQWISALLIVAGLVAVWWNEGRGAAPSGTRAERRRQERNRRKKERRPAQAGGE
ncbi:MAG: prolipoprotein diacylglyceryl transferase [Thermoleophilia bacterium]